VLKRAVADDVEGAREGEPERFVEGPALLRIRDPNHRVQEARHDGLVNAASPTARIVPIQTFMQDSAAAIDPVLEERLTQARERAVHQPVGREGAVRAVFAVLFLSLAVPLALFADTHRHPVWWAYPAFAAAYAVASSTGFELGAGLALPTELVFVPMLFILPARCVPLVVAAGLLLNAVPSVARGKLSVARALVWPPVNSIFALGPALVFVAAGEPTADGRGAFVLAIALAVQFALDASASCGLEWLANRVPPVELVEPLRWTFTIDLLLAPLGFTAAVAARVWPVALVLPVSIVGLLALFARERRERLDSMLELSAAYRGTALLLGDVVEADDEYTGDHSRQVLDLVLNVADRLSLDARDRRLAEFAALLHDVGKIRVPSEILNKPGALTPEERAIVNAHTIEGERLLRRVGGLLGEVGGIVRSCHERWDGNGYPDGLPGEEIPEVARIVACCDAYNAMTTDRPYRKSLGHHAAVAELLANRGTQFDPTVVDALLDVIGRPALAPPVAKAADRSGAGLLACPRCGHHSMLDEPVQENSRLCLRCGLVPIRVAS
jgi:HD-GYP domain-containing protein (c-di-GMP phosphodiesterase class II)